MKSILAGLGGLALIVAAAFWFLSGPDIPRSRLEAKYAKPPSEFIVLPDGARAHIRDRGPRDAPVLVLIHGSNASLFTWEPWANRLDDSFRVVTFDLPGHGLTGAVPNGDYSLEGRVRFAKEIADKLGLASFSIGGHSMGGAVAARFAEEYPRRVSHLILVDAADLGGASRKIPLAFRLARIPLINRILLHITPRSLVVEGLNDAIVRKKVITQKMIDRYWDFARMAGTRQATIARFRLPEDRAAKDDIREIEAPTLILWGKNDPLIPVSTARKIAAEIPASTLIVYPHTGHIPQDEVAARSAADVRLFLDGVAGAQLSGAR